MCRRVGAVFALACAAAAFGLAGAGAASADYGRFLNVLPGGEGQTVNASELAQYELTGKRPDTFTNQLPLYEGLLYGARNLRPADLGRYFKAEGFGVDAAAAGSTEMPRAGVVITRDKPWGVAHVQGANRSDAFFGIGYAQAEDRLFFMDLLRHLGRGRLAEFVGPGPNDSFLRMDAAQLRTADYTEAELGRLIESGVRAAGSDGPRIRQDLNDFTDGINAYIAVARTNPTKLPGEYPGIGKLPEPWQAADTAAVASLIAGMFGYGGGREVNDAAILQAARARFGRRAPGVFRDFRRRNDPEAPVTTTRRFRFDRPGRVDRRSVAMPDPGSLKPSAPVVSSPAGARRVALAEPSTPGGHSSTLLVTAARSRYGHPLAVMGPQIGFFSPEALVDIDVHAPGVNVRGVMLPGVFLAIMGRGPDFAWSATTAETDDTDQFVERLCNANRSRPTLASDHYVYRGRCIPFTRRDQVVTTPGPTGLDPTAVPETISFKLERSVHGPIQARAKVRGAPVAIALARSSYFHDLDSAEGFNLVDSGAVRSARGFQRAMARVNLGFNWLYADDRDIGFIQSGWYPHRARGTDPSLPAWGTGRWDWRGFRPTAYTSSRIGFRGLPKDVNPRRGYLINWNNDAARGWSAADNVWNYSSIHRSQLFEKAVRRALGHGGRLDLVGLVRIMVDAVTVDLRGRAIYPLLRRVIGKVSRPAVAGALGALDRWVAHGAHRRDMNRDNVYEDSAGVALMDAWWPLLVRRVFTPVLGTTLLDRIAALTPFDDPPANGPSAYGGGGWWGYLDKDLRALLGRHARGRLSRRYCGQGSLRRCRAILISSLTDAVAQVRATRGGDLKKWAVPATCKSQPAPQACDQIQFETGGGVGTPPIPWQNRPTFQQVVEVRGHRPR